MKINYGRGEFFTYGFAPILQSFGGDLIDRSTYLQASGVLDGPKSVAAMQRFQSWFEKGWADKSATTDDDFYGTKKAALAWVGHWMYKPHAKGLGSERAVPSPNTPAYTVISKAFAEAVDNIINGADVKTELSRAARTIDQDIKAHQGYPIQ
ncbi:MAG: hypothetical protein ABW098_07225 [Candidatus Thiodiazotropha sp.]